MVGWHGWASWAGSLAGLAVNHVIAQTRWSRQARWTDHRNVRQPMGYVHFRHLEVSGLKVFITSPLVPHHLPGIGFHDIQTHSRTCEMVKFKGATTIVIFSFGYQILMCLSYPNPNLNLHFFAEKALGVCKQ